MDTGEIHSSWPLTSGVQGPWQPAQSLLACHAYLATVLQGTRCDFPPATIAFEMPTGRHRNPSLVMHTGVIVLAAAQATGSASVEGGRDGVEEGHPRVGERAKGARAGVM
jgi:hypothetical protein